MRKKELFFSKHGVSSYVGDPTLKYFYTDGTYQCEHWVDNKFYRWKIVDGVAMWRDNPSEKWRCFTTHDPYELAAELEMELAIFKLLKG